MPWAPGSPGTTLESSRVLYEFPAAAVTHRHTPVSSNNRDLSSHGSGGQKSEIEVSARLISSEGPEGGSVPGLSPAAGVCSPLKSHLRGIVEPGTWQHGTFTQQRPENLSTPDGQRFQAKLAGVHETGPRLSSRWLR